MKKILKLIRTEGVSDQLIEFAKEVYRKKFYGYLEVEVARDEIDLGSVPFRAGIKGRQYLADEILEEGLRLVSARGGVVIIITCEDIYTHGTNYIFGLATTGGGLISSARIDPKFWDGVPEIFHYSKGGDEFFLKQFAKVLLHEAGHALSLDHCKDLGCVMHYSNSPLELYSKGGDFCSRCWNRLVANLGAKD
jgi:predicted Zn-dependent protease